MCVAGVQPQTAKVFNLSDASVHSGTTYSQGAVLVVIDAPIASNYEVMGAFNRGAYSRAVSNQAESFARNRELEVRNTFPEIAKISGKNIIHLRSTHKSTAQLIRELASISYVESIQPNYRVTKRNQIPNDPLYPLQWGMTNIRMPEVWNHFTGNDTVVVAILDSGVNYNHPDLQANMAIDSFGNPGRFFFNGGQSQSGSPLDWAFPNGHGTHVAGIIGAVGNNGIGVVGVNWNVKMLAVNVLTLFGNHGMNFDDLLYEQDSNILAGIEYVLSEKAKGLNIRVVNMSFAGVYPYTPPAYAIAMKSLSDAGIISVIAAGNNGLNLNNWVFGNVYPAGFKFANNISVGAIDINDQRSSFSNFGNQWVDIAAPGTNI